MPSHAPLEDHPLAVRREPSALEGWTLEVLYCDPKDSRAFLRILSAEGQGVHPLYWAHSKPEGPKAVLSCGSFLQKSGVLAYPLGGVRRFL